MLDPKERGRNLWKGIQLKSPQNPEEIWIEIATLICAHITENAEVTAGIEVTTSSGTGSTTGQGKIR